MARCQVAADQATRYPMRSPGRPPPRRDVERAFWEQIAEGLTSEDAAIAVGVSGPVGSRWFRHAGGMAPLELSPPTGRYLSFDEREEIALLNVQHVGVRDIARRLGRDPGTISRELRRNTATRAGQVEYRASVAQWKAENAAKRPKQAKLVTNPAFVTTCNNAWKAASACRTGRWFKAPTHRSGRDGTSHAAKTGDGSQDGARNRSPSG